MQTNLTFICASNSHVTVPGARKDRERVRACAPTVRRERVARMIKLYDHIYFTLILTCWYNQKIKQKRARAK